MSPPAHAFAPRAHLWRPDPPGTTLAAPSAGALLAARTAPDTVTAVSAVCTHAGCAVTGISGNNCVCPCHGSTFTFAGDVTRGPATLPLTPLATQFSGTTFTVTF